ncbi:hypothetical protein DFH28DRAFT_907149, partial [Melampsora americana]
FHHFFDSDESCTKTKLPKAVNPKTQAWFAYLVSIPYSFTYRMSLGIFHNTSTAGCKKQGGLSNWCLIDHKLAELCSKNCDYCQAYFSLNFEDQGLFNGNNKWDEVKTNDQFQNPTKDNVIIAIPFLPVNTS